MEKMEEIERLRQEREKLLNKQKTKAEIKKMKKEIFFLKNPILIWIGNFSKSLFNIAGNLGDSILGKNKSQRAGGTKTDKSVPTQKPTHKSGGVETDKTNKSVPTQKPSGVSGVLSEMDKTMKNIDKSLGDIA